MILMLKILVLMKSKKKKIYIRNISHWDSLIQNNQDLNREFTMIESSYNIKIVWYEMFLYLCTINLRFSVNCIVYVNHNNKWVKGTIIKSRFIYDNKMRLYLVKLESNGKNIFVDDDDKSSISLVESISFSEKTTNSLGIKIDSPTSIQQNILSEKNTRFCKVCYEEESRFIYIPCGHLCICDKCKNKF